MLGCNIPAALQLAPVRLSWGKPGPSSCASLSTSHTRRMRDVFACIKCQSIYEITRHRRQPLAGPRCEVCHAQFPPNELGDWLSYQRAEPEWTVGEWLGVHTQFSRSSSHQAFAGPAQRRISSIDRSLPSSRLRKPSSIDSPRAIDER
jgi:hypothetical protein